MEENDISPIPSEENAKPAPAKRGRPRKNPLPEGEAAVKVPAKRGRPRKNPLPEGDAPAAAAVPSAPAPETAEAEVPPPEATPAKREPRASLFSFDPDEDDAPAAPKPVAESAAPAAAPSAPVSVNPEDARPRLSPERPIDRVTENVYSPEDDDAPAASDPSEEGDAGTAAASAPKSEGAPAAARSGFFGRGDRWEKRQPSKFNPQDRAARPQGGAFRYGAGSAPAASEGGAPASSSAPSAQNPAQPSQQQPRREFGGGNNGKPRFQPTPKKEKFQGGKFNAQGRFEKFKDRSNAPKPAWGTLANSDSSEVGTLDIGNSFDYNKLKDEAFLADLEARARRTVRLVKVTTPAVPASEDGSVPAQPAKTVETRVPTTPGEPLDFNALYDLPIGELVAFAGKMGVEVFRNPQRRPLIRKILNAAFEADRPIRLTGTLELLANGNGLLLYAEDNFCVRELSAYVPALLIKKYSLQRGHELNTIVHPPMPGETAPIVVAVNSVMGADPEEVKHLTPFTELTPYYPTERIMLEMEPDATNNLSMRCVDLLCPIGLGQRGLIVAPPRVGKTVLLQTMANAILKNKPKAKLIVLLVDERPEEVTDFKRNTLGAEIIASTFDESAENHAHVAEMVIERARRMVELGMDVIILLDSITRLARAYNTLQPSGGKLLSGGIEAGALAKPKRFFGSARNIEGGGSLTILGTALIGTGSTMDEVIFEEFKGTGNMELDLDRDLANKRIFPAINFERSGTRKEELLYHPQEMQCVYSMRRAMKGMPSVEAMEMLISRMKKTRTNAEFLMTLAGR
ncbi:MAG: transcription termination factor Rho [Candidatus Spyradosoma sp.]